MKSLDSAPLLCLLTSSTLPSYPNALIVESPSIKMELLLMIMFVPMLTDRNLRWRWVADVWCCFQQADPECHCCFCLCCSTDNGVDGRWRWRWRCHTIFWGFRYFGGPTWTRSPPKMSRFYDYIGISTSNQQILNFQICEEPWNLRGPSQICYLRIC